VAHAYEVARRREKESKSKRGKSPMIIARQLAIMSFTHTGWLS
jgi:hypothetical protein